MSTVPRIAPRLTLGNGVEPRFVSRDPAVVAAYQSDPRVHDRISARLARFIAQAGPVVIAHAGEWSVPTLLMYAGSDRLVDPAGSRAFAHAAPADVVTTVCFDEHYHEIFNEPDNAPVFEALRKWLDSKFPDV